MSFTISDPQREDDPLAWVNPSFERLTGYPLDEVVGHTDPVLIDWVVALAFPCQRPFVHNDGVAEVREAADFCRYYALLAEKDFGGPQPLTGPVGETNRLVLRPFTADDQQFVLARQVLAAGLVPIVEPEVLMDGDHDIETCYEVTEVTLRSLFDALYQQNVLLEGTILKASMVLPGTTAAIAFSNGQSNDGFVGGGQIGHVLCSRHFTRGRPRVSRRKAPTRMRSERKPARPITIMPTTIMSVRTTSRARMIAEPRPTLTPTLSPRRRCPWCARRSAGPAGP